MLMSKTTSFKYLVCSDRDRLWGITVETVGEYSVEPEYAIYPPPTRAIPTITILTSDKAGY